MTAIVVASFLFFFAADVFGLLGRGRAAAVCAIGEFCAIQAWWRLRKRPLFWTVVAVVTAIHVGVVLFIPWTNERIPGAALTPFGLADFALVYGVFKVLENVIDSET